MSTRVQVLLGVIVVAAALLVWIATAGGYIWTK